MRLLKRGKRIFQELEEEVVLSLSEGDEPEVGKVIRGKEVQE
jgi:hypothetical protein